MHMLVGLGNPGSGYAGNRHNIGFMAADEIFRRHSFSSWKSKFQGEVAHGQIGSHRVLALKPTTYMNSAGRSVSAAATFYRIPPEDIIVMHDELDLAGGKIRTKRGGGHAGHNGLRSIHSHMGEGYARIRLGIGHPGSKERVIGHVLKDFSKEELIWVAAMTCSIADNIDAMLAGNDGLLQTRVAEDLAPLIKPSKGEIKPPEKEKE